ncbi:MAG: c-type cytochrome domain-containing protein [Myxococcota bacterium]
MSLSAACSDGHEPFETSTDGSDDTDIYIDVTFEEYIEPKLSGCVGCHQGEKPDGALDLTGDLYDKLMTLPSGQTDMALIEPGDANYSYIWHKINGSQSLAGGAGTRMPLGTAWSEEDIELLALWIDLGAKR